MEDEYDKVYQKVLAEHERYMERAVPYKSLRYIRQLAKAGQPQEIRAVRLQDGRVTGKKQEVLEEVAESFQGQHNQDQQGLSETTLRMVGALPRVFNAEQSEAIRRRKETLGEMKEAVQALKRKKSPGVDQLVAEAYQNLGAPQFGVWRGGSGRCCAQGSPRWSRGAR